MRRCSRAVVAALMAVVGSMPGPVQADDGPLGFDDDPDTLHRIDVATPVQAALAVSRMHVADDGAGHAVLARADDFADALAGAPLADAAPMLLTPGDALDPDVREELDRVLARGDRIYLLGGDAALASGIEAELRSAGYVVQRLAGASRIETAIAIAEEVLARRVPGSPAPTIVLVRAHGTAEDPTAAWADSVAGGAWATAAGASVLLTPSDRVHDAVAAAIERFDPAETVLLGGEAALSRAVEQAVPSPRRVAGTDRAATAVEVARQLWGDQGPPTRLVLVNLHRPDGWAFGLAVAGGAARAGAPVLAMAADSAPAATRGHVEGCDDLLVVGDRTIIADAAVGQLDRADPGTCPPPPQPPGDPDPGPLDVLPPG